MINEKKCIFLIKLIHDLCVKARYYKSENRDGDIYQITQDISRVAGFLEIYFSKENFEYEKDIIDHLKELDSSNSKYLASLTDVWG